MPRPPSDWITLGEAADILAASNIQVSRSTLARWASSGRLQSVRPGRRIYVRRTQIRALLHPRGNPPAYPPDGYPEQDGLFDDFELGD